MSEPAAETTELAKPQGLSISSMVNQDHANQIVEMGFSKVVAEKALFMTQPNSTVEKAMGWIEQHMEDADF